jgi:hypothetical protein
LAEVTAAYTVFNSALDGYLAGDTATESFGDLVTDDYLQTVVAEESHSEDGARTVGASSFSEEKLADTSATAIDDDFLLVVCRDISRTRRVAPDGQDVTSATRRERIPTAISFQLNPGAERELLVMGVDQWNEAGYCE